MLPPLRRALAHHSLPSLTSGLFRRCQPGARTAAANPCNGNKAKPRTIPTELGKHRTTAQQPQGRGWERLALAREIPRHRMAPGVAQPTPGRHRAGAPRRDSRLLGWKRQDGLTAAARQPDTDRLAGARSPKADSMPYRYVKVRRLWAELPP